MPQEDTGSSGPFGFLGNLFGGVRSLATGLAGIGGSVVHDIGRGLGQLIPGRQDWGVIADNPADEYRTDDIALALPGAIAHDFATRYGPLFRGDFAEFGSQLYEQPLSFGLDVLGVGSLAGTGARLGAKAALRGTEALGTAETLAESLRLAGAGKNAVAAGLRGGLDELAAAGPLSGPAALARAILPKAGEHLIGERLVPFAPSSNPVLRGIISNPATRLVTTSPAGAAAIAKARLWSGARKVLGEASATFIRSREARLGQVQETLAPYMRDATFADRAHGAFMGLDVDVADLVPGEEWAASGVVGAKQASLGGGVATALETALDPEIRAAAEQAVPLMLKRADDLASRVRASVGEVADDATDRYVSGLYDSVRRRVAHERAGPLDDVTLAQDDTRLMVAEWQQGMIEKLGWTPEQIMERSYRPLAMKYGLHLENGEWVGGPSWRELDDAFRAAAIPQPVYFPFMDATKLKFRDFLQGKARIGAVKASRDPNMKLMSGALLRKGSYVTDPIEVYSRRAARATRAEETWNLIEAVRERFGRPISSLDELTDSEVVLAPDGLLRFFKGKVQFEDVFDDLLSKGADADPAIAEALAQVMDMAHGDLETLASYLGVTTKGLKLYAIPKVVGRQMDAYARWTGAVSSPAVRLFWDKPSDVWRGMVLSGSPRWVINNALGNTIFLKMQGARVRDVAQIAEARLRKWWAARRGQVTEPELLRSLDELVGSRNVGSGFSSKESLYTPHLGSAADTATGRLYETLGATRGVQAAKQAGGFMRRLNGAIEDTFRQASYIKALERQQVTTTARIFWSTKARIERLSKGGITEGMATAALGEVNRFLGNYGALGPFERNVIRRFIAPFYSFYKHQAKLLVTFPIEAPGRAGILRQLAELQEEMVAQYGPVPEWLEGATPFGPPGAEGPIPFFTSAGPNPFNASFSPFTSGLHPAIKMALERAGGKNLFTGQPFSDPDIIRPYGTDQAFQIIRDAQGNPIDVIPLEGQPLPGFLEHLLQQVPQYEMAEEAIAGGKTYDTATLLDALGGNAAIIDPETGQPKYPTDVLQQLLKLSGLGVTPFDLAGYQQRQEELLKAARTQALR